MEHGARGMRREHREGVKEVQKEGLRALLFCVREVSCVIRGTLKPGPSGNFLVHLNAARNWPSSA